MRFLDSLRPNSPFGRLRAGLWLGIYAPVSYALLFVVYLGVVQIRAAERPDLEAGKGSGHTPAATLLVTLLGVAGSLALARASSSRIAAHFTQAAGSDSTSDTSGDAAGGSSGGPSAGSSTAPRKSPVSVYQEQASRALEAAERSAQAMRGLNLSAWQPLDSAAVTIEEVNASIVQLAERAEEAQQFTQDALIQAAQGVQVMASAEREIQRVADMATSSMRTIQSLDQKSTDIDGIAAVIKDIADQTNVLAINAAIEAARAGMHGRGFVVVADAVRRLAERTAQSTRQVTAIVAGIRQETSRSVQAMEQAQTQISIGRGLSRQAADALSRIHEGATRSVQTVRDIANGTRLLKSASLDITRDIVVLAQTANSTGEAIQLATAMTQDVLTSLAELKAQLRAADTSP